MRGFRCFQRGNTEIDNVMSLLEILCLDEVFKIERLHEGDSRDGQRVVAMGSFVLRAIPAGLAVSGSVLKKLMP